MDPLKLAKPVVVLDLETTGTWVEKDRIVEIAMVKLAPGGARETFQSRVNPGMPIPPRVSEIIGITDADVKEAPPFKKIAPEALNFIGECDLGGFNVERFDLVILEREFFLAGLKFEWRTRVVYDAQKIYHLHEKRTLTAAYQFYCQKKLEEAHTALGDAQATVEILASQIERYGKPEEGLASLRNFEYEKKDDHFDAQRKFRWWNGELYPVFGRYAKRSSLREIARKDPGYLEWMIASDFPQEVKAMLQGALAGRFPKPPGGESS